MRPLVVLECDGVVADLHTDGHRVAFNASFADLGLDCANWTPDIYSDLVRSGDGSEEGLVKFFFEKVSCDGWICAREWDLCEERIVCLKKEKLEKMLQERAIPLRPGLLGFVDEVLEHDALVAVLTGTQSDEKCKVWPQLQPLFGDERLAQIQSIAWPESLSKPEEDEVLKEKTRQKKREEAEAFVSTMNARRREKQVGMALDPSLFQSNSTEVDPSFFLSMVVSLGSSVRRCVLVGAHNFLLQSASASGILCVAVPAGRASRQVFPAAQARFDGFGAGGGLSWPNLASLMNNRSPPASTIL